MTSDKLFKSSVRPTISNRKHLVQCLFALSRSYQSMSYKKTTSAILDLKDNEINTIMGQKYCNALFILMPKYCLSPCLNQSVPWQMRDRLDFLSFFYFLIKTPRRALFINLYHELNLTILEFCICFLHNLRAAASKYQSPCLMEG